jgi:hypothetical protein
VGIFAYIAVREMKAEMPRCSFAEALMYAIHSRLPVIPDFPPWAVTIAAAHGESVRAQTRTRLRCSARRPSTSNRTSRDDRVEDRGGDTERRDPS